MRFARPILAFAVVALAAAPVSGCGSGGDGPGYGPRDTSAEQTATATTPAAPPGAAAKSCTGTVAGTAQLRVTGIGCDSGRGVVAAWSNRPACNPGNEASRVSCSVGDGYRCLGARVERGVAVSCSAPGRSLSFVVDRG
jgi:hypothetical protein